MVVYCTVCMNNTRKTKNISYFNYPKEENRYQEWLKAVGREDLLEKFANKKIRQQFRICEEHFERSCINISKKRFIKYLYPHAFPTLNLHMNFGLHLSSDQIGNVSVVQNQNVQNPIEISSNSSSPVYVTGFEDQISYNMQTDSDIQTCESRPAQAALSEYPEIYPRVIYPVTEIFPTVQHYSAGTSRKLSFEHTLVKASIH